MYKTFPIIKDKKDLQEAIEYIHFGGYSLCKLAFGTYFANAGNIGIFCHDEDEYKNLLKIREGLTRPSDNPKQKYFTLKKPIEIHAERDVPKTIYRYLYIRKPDDSSYGRHVGDIDFYVPDEDYGRFVSLTNEEKIPNAELYFQAGIGEIIQVANRGVGVLAYVSTLAITEALRVRQD